MTALTPEQRDLLALHLTPGIGPRIIALLLERFGSASAARRASASALATVPRIGEETAAKFRQALDAANVDEELELADRHGVRLVFHSDPEYPAALAPLPRAPFILYVRGSFAPQDSQAVAIVGSRHCTPSGRKTAERIAFDLARAGWTVVSGLARGIDGAAHRGALQAGGRTLAVLAGGLSSIYPPEHADLAEQVQAAGALISEVNMRQEPLPGAFPARNRIISGLCRGVVIVEAAEGSGSLYTAEHASEQGREVFVVPGPVDSASSAGALKLLRTGARMVRGAQDVIEDLQGIAPPVAPPAVPAAPPAPVGPPPGLNETQLKTWSLLADGPLPIDVVIERLGLSAPEAARLLMGLELKKVVRKLPGNRYERA